MGNYEQLKQSVSDVIKTNGNQEITGSILQNVLLTIISTVGANATFAGIATPTTNPGTPDGSVFYLASEGGTYTNFNAIELQDGLSVLMWNGTWSSQQVFSVDDVPTAGSDNLVKSSGVFNSIGAIKNVNQEILDRDATLFEFDEIESVGTVENGKNAQTSSTGSKVSIVNGDSTYNLLTYNINGEKYFKCKCTSYNNQRFGVGVYFTDSDNNILGKWYSEKGGKYIVTLSVPDGAAKIYINGIGLVPECTSGTLSDEPKYIAELTNEKKERENFDIELESKTVGTIVTHEFTSESYAVNLDFNYKAGDEVTIEVFTDDSVNTRISGNSTTPYQDGDKYPYVHILNGYGKATYIFNEDGKLNLFGYRDGTHVTNEFVANFRLTIISNNNEFSAIKECSDIKNEIADIKSYIQQIAQANGFIRIFHSMGVIGDSLSSGEIVTGSGTEEDPTVYNDRYNFSWLANMARKYSADWRCFSNGGQTAQGWLERWLPQLTSEENRRSLYFIALGTNDEGLVNGGQLALGTKNSSADESSFAGYYKRIIESVHAYSEHSIIMCCTTYGKQTVLSPINNLIQEISDLYDYCYFINIAQKSTFNLRFNDYERHGHFDTMGYVKIADAIEILVDDVIENNKTELATWGVNAPN